MIDFWGEKIRKRKVMPAAINKGAPLGRIVPYGSLIDIDIMHCDTEPLQCSSLPEQKTSQEFALILFNNVRVNRSTSTQRQTTCLLQMATVILLP